jgi:phosphate transport system substrate-binding protein
MKFSFMKTTKLLTVVAGVSLLAFALSGCGAKEEAKDTGTNGGLTGNVQVIGSTSVGPLARTLSDAFTAVNTGVTIDIQEIGSTEGIKAVSDGTADIGTSSRDLKDDEKTLGLTEHVIAYDGIAVVVNPANKVSDLSKDQIAKIFKGEIKNWKEVGGDDKPITVVTREAGSGTRGAFQELLKLEEKQADGTKKSLISEKALVTDSTGSAKTTVSGNESAIGYVSLGALDNTVKATKVEGIEPTVETVKAKTYPIYRPFLMLTKGEMKPEVKAYIDFIMSADGQKLVVEDKFVSVK